MSDFGNKNVRYFALFALLHALISYCWAGMPNLQAHFLHYSCTLLHKSALISRVDFSQPKCNGRLKSTLLADCNNQIKNRYN